MSPDTKEILDTFGTFELELRGPVEMKVRHALPVWYQNLDIYFGIFINSFFRNFMNVFINNKKGNITIFFILQGKGSITTYWLTGERVAPMTSGYNTVIPENPPSYDNCISDKWRHSRGCSSWFWQRTSSQVTSWK